MRTRLGNGSFRLSSSAGSSSGISRSIIARIRFWATRLVNGPALDTAADRQSEERFLFELATSRATEETILSYPRFNEQGEDTLPSFFIDGSFASDRIAGRSCRAYSPESKGRPEDRRHVEYSPKTLSPTGIESFLQCPFQFFASKTLRLRRRPPQPRDRLDLLLQGSILHRALAEWTRAPLLGSAILDEIFEEECARVRVPEGYRTEAVRLELMRHFRGFLDDTQFALRGWAARSIRASKKNSAMPSIRW